MSSHVTVVGAGPGALAVTADAALRGHRVALYDRSPTRLAALGTEGGIRVEIDAERSVVAIDRMTTDPAEALEDAMIVLVAVPAYAQAPILAPLLPHLRDDMTLVLMPGCCGSLEVAGRLADAGLDVVDGILLGEAITLPRFGTELPDGSVKLLKPAPRTRLAAFPARRSAELAGRLADLLTPEVATNVLDPGLNNPNFLFHPGPMVLNHAAIERRNGQLGIMNEGVTAGVLRTLDALDTEKARLMEALGLPAIAIDDLYRDETGHSPDIYRRPSPGGPRSAQREILPRFLDEDVTFGIVLLSSLGASLGVPMPLTDATIAILSVAEGRDLAAGGRTAASLGLAGLSSAEVGAYLDTGWRIH